MHALNPVRSIQRVAMILPAIALLATGCNNRDSLAPDCFEYDPVQDICLVPDPGGTAVGINCQLFPEAAVGADYSFTPEVGGGSGNYTMWEATNLPPGLDIDSDTGEISGVPTTPMAYQDITISVFDSGKGSSFDAECGELVVNPALSSNPIASEALHCLPYTATKAEMVALLSGGDGSEITCIPPVDSGSDTCPYGDGNGRPAPGITFDGDSCTHGGSLVNDALGTWVWMVEVEQNGYRTAVPYCATNDVSTYHDISLTALQNPDDGLTPGFLEYDLTQPLSFGSGSYAWEIDDPNCPGVDCNNFGFRFDVTCSPFDAVAPWEITLSPSMGTETGLIHEMTATGPVVSDKFTRRPFVTSFEMAYCTSAEGSFCDVDSASFGTNAQTKHHFDVIGFPDN